MLEGFSTEKIPTICAVLVPVISKVEEGQRSDEARLEEAIGLSLAIELDVRYTQISKITRVRPATLFGSGKVDEIKAALKDNEVQLTVVDYTLTPVQQRNLEKAWQTKVLDRTGIILEIFGARAQTREGTLQVDLAVLKYQRGRLVRSWTHLERQRGGGGFLGGPGETQIEADRRALQTKIERLEKQLEQVRRTRSLHRKQRKKQDIPIITLVGYTNAGKSTLFNKITQADVFAENLLFATLDPTLRRVDLGEGTMAVLSDTVGFISSLPTDLIAAFRATLEEVTEADIIVHVRDIADEDHAAQNDDVRNVLLDLDVDIANPQSLKENNQLYVEVWNKIDLLTEEDKAVAAARANRKDLPSIYLMSAQKGEGVEAFLQHIKNLLEAKQTIRTITLNQQHVQNAHHAYKLGTVLSCEADADGNMTLRVKCDNWRQLNRLLMQGSA